MRVFLCSLLSLLVTLPGVTSAELPQLETAPTQRTTRTIPDGSGPMLPALKAATPSGARVASDPAPSAGPGGVYVDLPCTTFLPGKANPSEFMATATFVMATQDGYNYQYGYDPFAQSYKVAVSGLAVPPGILAQETVGTAATQLPSFLTKDNVDRVELWFVVEEHNLFPSEWIGITGLEEGIAPSTSLNSITGQLMFEDARGYAGSTYFLDHLAIGAHAIDLGEQALIDLREQIDLGWFGVGFAADGWDLGGSLGEVVFWKMFGGGTLDPAYQPFFRIYYNAAPAEFELVSPAAGTSMSQTQPTFVWREAVDPNGDVPVEYTLRLSSDPQMTAPFSLDAGEALHITTPFPLAAGTYYWEVVARDPRGAERVSEQRTLHIQVASDADAVPMAFQHGAYPNPFNPHTTIRVALTDAARVDLSIFDVRGQRVRTLAAGDLHAAGHHEFRWDGSDLSGRRVPTGTYFYRLQAGDHRVTRKLNLVK